MGGGRKEAGERPRVAARPLWQWCRLRTSRVQSLPPAVWATYGEAEGREIEEAYLDGDESVTIEVCIS